MKTMLAFALTVTLNGSQVAPISYWESIDRCRYFADRITKQKTPNDIKRKDGGRYYATCVPIMINPNKDRYWR